MPGIADYYTLILPFHFGVYTTQKFLANANREAVGYYTNPFVTWNNTHASDMAWQLSHAQRLPYYRGCIYFIKLDAQIRAASAGRRSLDDLMLVLLRAKNVGQDYGLDVWLKLLSDELGTRGIDEFYAMLNGSLVIPQEPSLYDDFELVREDQEPYDLGFDEKSLTERVIDGLDPHSRAAEAGLKNGDVVLDSTFMWETVGELDGMMSMKIRRGQKEMNLKYWPRSFDKVESYHWALRKYVAN